MADLLRRPLCWILGHKLKTDAAWHGLGASVLLQTTWCERCGKIHRVEPL